MKDAQKQQGKGDDGEVGHKPSKGGDDEEEEEEEEQEERDIKEVLEEREYSIPYYVLAYEACGIGRVQLSGS